MQKDFRFVETQSPIIMGFIKLQERLLSQIKPCSQAELVCFHLIYKTPVHRSIKGGYTGNWSGWDLRSRNEKNESKHYCKFKKYSIYSNHFTSFWLKIWTNLRDDMIDVDQPESTKMNYRPGAQTPSVCWQDCGSLTPSRLWFHLSRRGVEWRKDFQTLCLVGIVHWWGQRSPYPDIATDFSSIWHPRFLLFGFTYRAWVYDTVASRLLWSRGRGGVRELIRNGYPYKEVSEKMDKRVYSGEYI